MKFNRLILITLLLFSFCVSAEDSDVADVDSRLEYSYVNYYLNEDGTHVKTRKWAYTVLKERAVKGAKSYTLSYSTSVEKSEVIEAYTKKADGRRIDVPESNYQVKVNSGKGKNGPVFSDRTSMTVVFPEVEVGDTTVLSYKITQTEPIFPGHFSFMASYPKAVQDNDVQITINAPSGLWAQYEARDMDEEIIEKDGRKIIKWSYQNRKPTKRLRKNFSVYDIEKVPGYAYSTFKSIQEIAKAYGVRALPKAEVTERVQKLADEIVEELKEPREQARALYDWVATKISYAGNCVGVGAVVPHDISFILDNRMGDCKDKATLLQALLKAKGIDSTQALMNARSSYKLPKIPVVSMVNHVINYIPAFDLFLDPTASTTPYGMLPFSAEDKPVLLVEGYREGMKTPISAIDSNQEHTVTEISINSDGSIKGEMTVSMKGRYAVRARAQMRRLTKDIEERLVDEVYKRQGYIGSGSFEKDDPTELLNTYSYKVKAELQSYIQRPGAGAFNITPLFPTGSPISGFLLRAIADVESVDVACSSGISTEEYTYRFPDDMKILAVPDDMEITSEFLVYRASYKRNGNELYIKRRLEDKTKGNICSPDVLKGNKEFAIKALKNIKSQIVYM